MRRAVALAQAAALEVPENLASGICWTLWSVAMAVPWLLPIHAAPWTTVYQELLMAAALVGPAFWLLSRVRSWRLDALVAGTLVIACVPLLQAAAGMFMLAAEAPLVSMYLVGFALTILLARHAEELAPGRLCEALLASLLMASLASTGLALYQWLGGNALGNFAAPIPHLDRPVANVGQPNNLGTLLVWGLIATWWACLQGRIGALGAFLCAAWLLVGVTLTQSRAAALEVCLLAGIAFGARRRLRTSAQLPAFGALVLWWSACMLALEPLTQALTVEVIRPMLDTGSPRERMMLLKTVLVEIGAHPWIGYGWYQNVTAHVEVSGRAVMHGLIANAHNIVLDLVVWNGLPLGLAITLGLCLWFWRTARRAFTAEQVLLLAALGTFCIHASLELPHVFAYFLIPLAVFIGTLAARLRPVPDVLVLRRAGVAIVVVLMLGALAEIAREYGRIERNLTDARMRAAHIDRAPAAWDPQARLLSSLQSWNASLQGEPRRGMPAAEFEALRRVVTRYPTALGLLRYAQAAAMNERPAEARWALGVLCSVRPSEECRAAANDWAALSAAGRPELAAISVPVAVPASPLP